MRHYIAAAAVAGLVVGATASAESTADITVDSGSLATVELVVQISTTFGTDTDSNSVTKEFTGVGTAVVDSDVPPFLSLDLPSLSFDLGSADFGFQFFCLPIIGCQALDVSVDNFMIGLDAGGVSGPVKGGVANYPNAPFVSSFDYTVTGLADIAGSNVVPEVYPFSTGVTTSGDNLVLQDIALEPIVFEIPPEKLPTGVGPVIITANVDLSAASMSGLLITEPDDCAGDFNGDGQVDGADFGSILAAWGPCPAPCPEDLNGDGQVNGADVGSFLALWGPCP